MAGSWANIKALPHCIMALCDKMTKGGDVNSIHVIQSDSKLIAYVNDSSIHGTCPILAPTAWPYSRLAGVQCHAPVNIFCGPLPIFLSMWGDPV